MIDFGLIFMTGLLASLHCVGMCGPIVLTYSVQPGAKRTGMTRNLFSLHAAYNSGRVISYTLIGALFGLAGAAISSFQNFTEYFSILCGVLMIVAGIAMLDLIRIPAKISLVNAGSVFTKLHGLIIKNRTVGSKLLLGLLTPLLPCGILYAMFIKAASSGSFINGGITMALFGAGMAPALILIGSVSSLFSAKFRKRAEMVAAVTIILMGIILILRGFHVPYLKFLMGSSSAGGGSCCH